jgi:hypothetical protein
MDDVSEAKLTPSRRVGPMVGPGYYSNAWLGSAWQSHVTQSDSSLCERSKLRVGRTQGLAYGSQGVPICQWERAYRHAVDDASEAKL